MSSSNFDRIIDEMVFNENSKDDNIRFSVSFDGDENRRLENVINILKKNGNKKMNKQKFINSVVMAAVKDIEEKMNVKE